MIRYRRNDPDRLNDRLLGRKKERSALASASTETRILITGDEARLAFCF